MWLTALTLAVILCLVLYIVFTLEDDDDNNRYT